MTEYNSLSVKSSDSQLIKLKSDLNLRLSLI